MGHSYYRNPRGQMIKMGIMFASLCFSAYMLPKTLDKLGGAGVASILQPGGGISPEAQRALGQGGIESLLRAEQAAANGGTMVITPSGATSGEGYMKLQRQAEQMAPIKVVGKKSETASDGEAVAQEGMPTVEELLELLVEKKKGG